MDPRNLQTASLYVNNLLLSRGLLRNGLPVEFATPSKADGGTDATMAKIMNLIHDLILRRDREADVLSTLSQNTQNLRASATQQTQTIARLETRNTDLDRQLALLGAQERNARATLRSAETRTKVLKEEMARLKVTVAQIRGQCATDIRRRDGEINRLKRHLERRRGREGIGGQVGVVVVTPGLNKMQRGGRDAEVGVDLGRPDYSLKQETTEFLTQLSQGLSDENDALIELVKGTLATLRSLQGLPMILEQGSERSTSAEGQAVESGVVFLAPPPSCKVLTTDMGEVLEHLRSLLTNPSFVPLEELEVREDEIIRLREGWEKMEARWREAVALMDGWRKRMMSTGDTINLDDLTIGLNLGSGIPSAEETNEEVLSHKGDDGEQTEYNTSDKIQGDVEGLPGTYESFGNIRQQGDGLEMDLCPASKPLRASSGNARPFFTSIKSSIPVIPEEFTESTSNSIDPDEVSLLDFSASKDSQPLKQARSHLAKKAPSTSLSSPLTIQQKLAKVQAEAEDARKRQDKTSQSAFREGKGERNRRRSTLSPEELEGLMGGF